MRMKEEFTEFVFCLSMDAGRTELFRADPARVLGNAGLTKREMKLLQSGESRKVLAEVLRKISGKGVHPKKQELK